MATFSSWQIVAHLLQSDGYAFGDPPVSSIWEYYNRLSSTIAWEVFYDGQDTNQFLSFKAPILLWSRTDGLTEYGHQWLINKGVIQ